MALCYIGLGSNLGDRKRTLDTAVKEIKKLPLTRVLRLSSIRETRPQGGPEQGDYLNAVLEIETTLTPYQLLLELQRIENSLGRVRTVKNGPRTIDLDILLYGQVLINEEALTIPHPRILERDFIIMSFNELDPLIVKRLSAGGKTVRPAVRHTRKLNNKKSARAKKTAHKPVKKSKKR